MIGTMAYRAVQVRQQAADAWPGAVQAHGIHAAHAQLSAAAAWVPFSPAIQADAHGPAVKQLKALAPCAAQEGFAVAVASPDKDFFQVGLQG